MISKQNLDSTSHPSLLGTSRPPTVTHSNGGTLNLPFKSSRRDSKRNVYSHARLPWELLRNIIRGLEFEPSFKLFDRQHLDPALFVLARTCRALQVEAERVIYRRIVFRNGTAEALHIGSMLSNRAAEYVETLCVTHVSYPMHEPFPEDDRPATSLAHSLPFGRMKRLRSLNISFPPFRETIEEEVEEIEFFKVISQKLPPDTLHDFISTDQGNLEDLRFLGQQNQLRRLVASKLPDELLAPSTFPNLLDLKLERSEINQSLQILDTQALRALWVSFHDAHLNRPFCGVSLTVLDIEFDFVSPSDWVLLLNLRVVDCPNIVFLSLWLSLIGIEPMFLPWDEDENADWLSPIMEVLGRWRRMQALELRAWTSTPPDTLISRIKDACKTPGLCSVWLHARRPDHDATFKLWRDDCQAWCVSQPKSDHVHDWRDHWKAISMEAPLTLPN